MRHHDRETAGRRDEPSHAERGTVRIERDLENAWLAADSEAGPLNDLIGQSITYRIAVATRAGQKRFTSQTVPPRLAGLEVDPRSAARARVRVSRRTRQIPTNTAATGCGRLADDLLELAEEENVLPQLDLDPVFFQSK